MEYEVEKESIRKRLQESNVFTEEEIQFIANMPDDYVKAITVVGRIYAERKDQSGNPESRHLRAVSDALETYEGKVAGFLHDVVEDGYLTLGSLCFSL